MTGTLPLLQRKIKIKIKEKVPRTRNIQLRTADRQTKYIQRFTNVIIAENDEQKPNRTKLRYIYTPEQQAGITGKNFIRIWPYLCGHCLDRSTTRG